MQIPTEKLMEILVDPGHIDRQGFDDVVQKAKELGISPDKYIFDSGVLDDEKLGRAIADGLGFRFVRLSALRVQNDVLKLLSEDFMRSNETLVFKVTPESLHVASANPDNTELFSTIERDFSKKVEIYYTTPAEILATLRFYNNVLDAKLAEIIGSLTKDPENTENIVVFLDALLEYAHDSRASDIHIEPQEDTVFVRLRVDGVLHHVATYPKKAHEHVVSRVKILSRLRTDEHATPQDGRYDFKNDKVHFEVRVSLAPVTGGENIVMRLLEAHAKKLSLIELGIGEADLEKVKRAIEKPYGMILSVGPTGSGKTTTLYVLLELLNKPEVNIMTIEDPVEFDIERVQQIQVNPAKELLFSTGLRSIVRQDPDIIMVGEIRDNETADIAVNAAMTGHILLSTMHANDAATVFPRLVEMGVEPFLSASALVVIIAQRLIRLICKKCRVSYQMTAEELALFRADEEFSNTLRIISGKDDFRELTLYRGAGCDMCGNTGYLGRVGIFEVMEVNEELRSLVVANSNADEIGRAARKGGMTTMLENGMQQVVRGRTTLSEVLRAIKS